MFRFESPYLLLLFIFVPIFLDRTTLLQSFLIRSSALRLLFSRLFYENRSAQGLSKDRLKLIGTRYATPTDISSMPRSKLQTLRPVILSTLRIVGFLLLVIAAARPQYGNKFIDTQVSGRDILLALDLSGSMQAMDFTLQDKRVDRLTALKHVVKQFIEERGQDRFGLVVFGDQAFTQCPLTTDREAVKRYIDALKIGMAGQATAIGDALAVSIKRIKSIDAPSKTIVLVTDGKSNSGSVNPSQASELAQRLNIRIHTIGIGGNKPAPFPVTSAFGYTRYVDRVLEFDEDTLRNIAKTTGGEYFHAENIKQLERVYAQINSLEERREETKMYVHWEEHFSNFLLAGMVLLGLSTLLRSTVLVKVRL